jgi:hypothetical protein
MREQGNYEENISKILENLKKLIKNFQFFSKILGNFK